jgi:hypothetical protein
MPSLYFAQQQAQAYIQGKEIPPLLECESEDDSDSDSDSESIIIPEHLCSCLNGYNYHYD